MDFFKVPVFAYALIKFKLKTNLNLDKNNELTLTGLTVLLTILSLTIIYPILCLLILYTQITSLILYIKHGAKYRGLLSGIDTICAREKKSIINIITYVEYSGSPEQLLQALRDRMQQVNDTKKQEKLFFIKKSFFGLNYYLQHDFKSSELVRPMQSLNLENFDKNAIKEALRKEDQHPLPCNDEGLIELVVSQRVLTDEPFNAKPTYVVIFRMHHSLGDGISIFNVFSSQFIGKDLPEQNVTFMDKVKENWLEMKLVTANTEVKSDVTQIRDENILRTFDLYEDKNFVWYSEFKQDILLKIKKIRKFYNTSFLSVVNACLASTLYEYYQKHADNIPEKILSGVVYLPKPITIEYGKANIPLRNMFTAVCLEIPIKVSEKSHPNPMITRLQMIQQEHLKVMKSIDIQWGYWLAQYLCSLLPEFATNYLIRCLNITLAVSSLPGGDEFSFFGEEGYVKDFIPLSPNSTGTGLHTVVVTYGGNFKMSITADRAVIPKSEDAEGLVTRTIELINELAETCKV